MAFFDALLEDESDVTVIKRRFHRAMAASLGILVASVLTVAVGVLAFGVREMQFFFLVLGAGFALSVIFKMEAESMKNAYHRVKQGSQND